MSIVIQRKVINGNNYVILATSRKSAMVVSAKKNCILTYKWNQLGITLSNRIEIHYCGPNIKTTQISTYRQYGLNAEALLC